MTMNYTCTCDGCGKAAATPPPHPSMPTSWFSVWGKHFCPDCVQKMKAAVKIYPPADKIE